MKFTSEDLLKAMGLELGQIIELEYPSKFISYKIIKTHDIFIRLQNIKDVTNTLHIDTLLDRDYTIIQPKPILTEDEKVILRNLPKEYQRGYIARDLSENALSVLIEKPIKNDDFKGMWLNFDEDGEVKDYLSLVPFNHLFQFIKWEDEPYSIEELLKEIN